MVGALTGASKAECADGLSRPESPPPSYESCVGASDDPPAELAFSPAITSRAVEQAPQTLYDAMQKSPRAERIYLTRFERKVKLFITEHLYTLKGVKIPAEMYITANETKVATISRDYQAAQFALGYALPTSPIPAEPTLSKIIIGYMESVSGFLNYLTNKYALWDHSMAKALILEPHPDELKYRRIFRQLIALMDALIAEDVSRASTLLKDMADQLKLEINDQGKIFDELDEVLECIIGFIKDGQLTEGIDSDQKMFAMFHQTILYDLFPTEGLLGDDLFSSLKKSFAIYDQNMEYLRTLSKFQRDCAMTYFERFAHKELHFEMEERLKSQNPIESLDYQDYEDQSREILNYICLNPYSFHPNVPPLTALQAVLLTYLMNSFGNDEEVVAQTQDQINAQAGEITKLVDNVDYLTLETSILAEEYPVLSPEDAIKVVREVKFDPRCELIKNSYLALFETLAQMKLAIENPIVTYKPF